eukprot:751289-Hanusia_phi.AAC.6
MKSWDVNGVPIPMFFATHFYFTFYHALSNMAIRKTLSTYESGWFRTIYLMLLIFTMSYVTAFMEALTISGSADGMGVGLGILWVRSIVVFSVARCDHKSVCRIYFIVSFPMYFRVDELKVPHSAFQTAIESLASVKFVKAIQSECLFEHRSSKVFVPVCNPEGNKRFHKLSTKAYRTQMNIRIYLSSSNNSLITARRSPRRSS